MIIDEEMDFEMFPSANSIPNYFGNHKAFRIHDPDELILAILRYR